MNFIPNVIKDIEFYEMVENILGKRDFCSTFSYADIFNSLFCMNLIGGEHLHDIRHLDAQLDKKMTNSNFVLLIQWNMYLKY